MKDKLPKGWRNKNLNEVSKLIRGVTYKPNQVRTKENGIACFRTKNIQKALDESDIKYVDERVVKSEEKYLLDGDVLISSANSSELLGKCCVVSNLKYKATLGGFISLARPNEKIINKQYFYYYFNSSDYQSLIRSFANKTTGIANLPLKKVELTKIPVPPLNEQQKIVNVLDASLGKIDQAIALVNQNIEKLEQLNASILDEVFKVNDWQEDSLENLTTKIGSGSTPRGGRNSYKNSGISLIRSMNVHDNGFREKGLAFIDDEQAKKLSNVTIEENDVLLNITGASVARCCIIPKKYIPARVNQHVSILRCKKDKLLPEFLHLCLISPYYKNKLLISSGGGATREAITKTSLVSFKIKLPNIRQQKEIVKYLTNTRSKNQNLIQHYKNKLQSLQDLKKSVLDSAFKGKLKREVIKPLKEVKIIKFKELYPDPYIRKHRVAQKHKLKRRQVLTTTRIIALHQKHNQKLGHTKTEKINHAIEYIAQFELGRDPVKNTGGPVDFYYVKSFVEPFAKEKKVFEAIEKKKSYHYEKGINFNTFLKVSYNDKYFNNYNAKIDEIINTFLFQPLRETELYITVYTGWNNLIIRQEKVNLKTIHTESIELWIDKAEKFNITDVEKAINWLKTKNYMPAGYGKEVK